MICRGLTTGVPAVLAAQVPAAAVAQDGSMRAASSQAQAMRAQAAQAQRAQQRAARSGAGNAMVTAATVQATDAGECSPYLARWMQTKSMYWRVQYETCMED